MSEKSERLHRHGVVNGICSGVHYSTPDLAEPAIKILGMKKGFAKMTAMAIVLFKHTPLGDDLVYACADGTVIPRPTSEELADIAILSADKAKTVLPDVRAWRCSRFRRSAAPNTRKSIV